MSPRCILVGLQCPLCGSCVVRVSEADAPDRLICPICWAAGNYAEVMKGRGRLQRGTPIESRLRYLVDKARFPKPATPTGGTADPAQHPAAGGAAVGDGYRRIDAKEGDGHDAAARANHTADAAVLGASAGTRKAPLERG